jgi:hypothetical protein
MWSQRQKRFSCYKNEWTLVEKYRFNILTLTRVYLFILSKVVVAKRIYGEEKGEKVKHDNKSKIALSCHILNTHTHGSIFRCTITPFGPHSIYI